MILISDVDSIESSMLYCLDSSYCHSEFVMNFNEVDISANSTVNLNSYVGPKSDQNIDSKVANQDGDDGNSETPTDTIYNFTNVDNLPPSRSKPIATR